MPQLKDQVVIITGGSAGIGAAAARTLAREGARVVLAARRADRLEQLKQEIEQAGGDAWPVVTDITSDPDRRRLVEATLAQFGRIDGLVNNAGFGQGGPVETVPIEKVRQQFETNVFSLLALTQLVIPVMRRQGSGRIVIIGSVAGRITRPFSSIYDATKHALEAFSDGLRNELYPFGVRVVLIEPGDISTEFSEVSWQLAAPILNDASSPYAPFLAHGDATYKESRHSAAAPQVIADLIREALQAARPRPRYRGPLHAKFFLTLRWLMPDRFFDWVIRRQFGLTRENARAAAANAVVPSAR